MDHVLEPFESEPDTEISPYSSTFVVRVPPISVTSQNEIELRLRVMVPNEMFERFHISAMEAGSKDSAIVSSPFCSHMHLKGMSTGKKRRYAV